MWQRLIGLREAVAAAAVKRDAAPAPPLCHGGHSHLLPPAVARLAHCCCSVSLICGCCATRQCTSASSVVCFCASVDSGWIRDSVFQHCGFSLSTDGFLLRSLWAAAGTAVCEGVVVPPRRWVCVRCRAPGVLSAAVMDHHEGGSPTAGHWVSSPVGQALLLLPTWSRYVRWSSHTLLQVCRCGCLVCIFVVSCVCFLLLVVQWLIFLWLRYSANTNRTAWKQSATGSDSPCFLFVGF